MMPPACGHGLCPCPPACPRTAQVVIFFSSLFGDLIESIMKRDAGMKVRARACAAAAAALPPLAWLRAVQSAAHCHADGPRVRRTYLCPGQDGGPCNASVGALHTATSSSR